MRYFEKEGIFVTAATGYENYLDTLKEIKDNNWYIINISVASSSYFVITFSKTPIFNFCQSANCIASIDHENSKMACVLRKTTTDCLECSYLAEDGSCKRPFDFGCNTDEDILDTCDILYNAGYRHISESSTSKTE